MTVDANVRHAGRNIDDNFAAGQTRARTLDCTCDYLGDGHVGPFEVGFAGLYPREVYDTTDEFAKPATSSKLSNEVGFDFVLFV